MNSPQRINTIHHPTTSNKEIQAIARKTLLSYHDIQEQDLKNVLDTLLTKRIEIADIYLQHVRTQSWGLEESIVKMASFNLDQGFGMRAIAGEKTAFVYADDISLTNLQNAAKTVKSIETSGQHKKIQLTAPRSKQQFHHLYASADPALGLDSEQKVSLLQYIDQKARSADQRVKHVSASLSSSYEVIMIMTTEGRLSCDVRPLVYASVNIIVEQNGQRESGHCVGGGRFDLQRLTPEKLDQFVQEALHQALTNLSARPSPAGEMTVVLGPGEPGILLHEAVGHGLEADFNRKGFSAFSTMMGKRVAAKGVTVIDDGTLFERRGSLNIDDEGNPTQHNVLIEDGILCGYLQDTHNAHLMKVPPTGNGRRESYASLPMPRMTNTFMQAGDYSSEEVLSSVKRGLYAVNFSGGQVDITSGNFVFSAALAYWVENGKIQYPVKGATLIGHGPDALTKVSMIGNDFRLDRGAGECGKEGQLVPVGVGQPTLRIDSMTVGGTA